MTHTSNALFEYVQKQIENHGYLRGKVVFGFSPDGNLLLSHHLVSGEEELNFLEAISTRFKFEEVETFFLAFSGYIGEEKPKEDTILVVTGSSDGSAPYISQWHVKRNETGKIDFRDTVIETISEHNSLNLLRVTHKLSIQGSTLVLSKAATCPEKYILQGF